MVDERSYRLHGVAVVIIAGSHNPTILNPDFLKVQEIVPARWKYRETITTPPISLVSFENGIEFRAETDKLTIGQSVEGNFLPKYQVHELAEKYVKKLPHVPYGAVGMNCRVSTAESDPTRWLIDRFLRLGSWLNSDQPLDRAQYVFRFKDGTIDCNLTIQPGRAQLRSGEEAEPAILVDCNFHYPGLHKVPSLTRVLRGWPDRQAFLLKLLDQLLAGALE